MSAAVDHTGFAKVYAAEAAARVSRQKQAEVSKVTIEKGVTMPEWGCRALAAPIGRPPKYPFHEMDVGDSILFPSFDQSYVSSRAKCAAARLGFSFTTRKLADGVRVWRVA